MNLQIPCPLKDLSLSYCDISNTFAHVKPNGSITDQHYEACWSAGTDRCIVFVQEAMTVNPILLTEKLVTWLGSARGHSVNANVSRI
jgi:hypothetical protein